MLKHSSLYNRTFFFAFTYNFVVALNFTNNAIYPLYVKQMGGGAETVGLFMGAASFAALFARPLIGMAIDRLGIKLVLVVGSLSLSLPSLGYWAMLDSGLTPWVWLLRLVHGFGFGAHFSAFFTLAAQEAPVHRRNEAVAMYGLSGLFANIIGPFLGETVLDVHGLPSFFMMVTSFGLVGSLIIILAPLKRPVLTGELPSLKQSLSLIIDRRFMLVFLLGFLLSVCFYSPQTFLGPLAHDRGIDRFSLYFTGYALAGITIRLLGRKLGDRLGVRRLMVPGFMMYGMGMLTLFLAKETGIIMLAGCFSGVAHGIVFPAVHSYGYSLAPKNVAGSVMALLTGMTDIGGVVVGMAFGIVARHYGYASVFVLAVVAGWTAAALALISIVRRPEVIKAPK